MWNRFNVTAEFEKGKPYLLRFFDQVRFFPVKADELLKIRRDFIAGKYHLRMEKSTFDIRGIRKILEDNADSIHAFETAGNRRSKRRRPAGSPTVSSCSKATRWKRWIPRKRPC